MGYSHIPQHFATRINAFYTEHLNPYLNLHRPCLFATERADAKRRVRKIYFSEDVQTPLEKLSRLTSSPLALAQAQTSVGNDFPRRATAVLRFPAMVPPTLSARRVGSSAERAEHRRKSIHCLTKYIS